SFIHSFIHLLDQCAYTVSKVARSIVFHIHKDLREWTIGLSFQFVLLSALYSTPFLSLSLSLSLSHSFSPPLSLSLSLPLSLTPLLPLPIPISHTLTPPPSRFP